MQGHHSRFNRELDSTGGSHAGKYQSDGHTRKHKQPAVAFVSCSVDVSHYAVVRSVCPIVLICMLCPRPPLSPPCIPPCPPGLPQAPKPSMPFPPPPPPHTHPPNLPAPLACLKPLKSALFPLPLQSVCLLGEALQQHLPKVASCQPFNHKAMSVCSASCHPNTHRVLGH